MESTTGGTSGMGGGTMSDPRETGTALLREGRFDEAASVLREAVTLDPADEGSWRMLGAALSQKGDHPGAVEAFSQAANLAPMAAKSHYNLGLAYQGANRIPEARAALEKSLALDPGYEQAKQRLAELSGAAMSAPPPVNLTGGAGSLGTIGSAPSLGAVGQVPAPPPLGRSSFGSEEPSGLSSVGSNNVAPPPPVRPASLDTPSGNARAYGDAPPTLRPAQTDTGAYAPPPMLGMRYGDTANTSGMKADVPMEVAGGFNWGAFGLNWIWLLNMGQKGLGLGYLGASILVNIITFSMGRGASPNTGGSPASTGVSLFFSLIFLGVNIWLGVVGNKMAWQNRRFQSVEDFKACQRTWGWWVLGLILFNIVMGFLLVLLLGAAIVAGAAGRGR